MTLRATLRCAQELWVDRERIKLDEHGAALDGVQVGTSGVCAREPEMLEKLKWWANCTGITGAPFDSFLTLRGLRTLHARMRAHLENARQIVDCLVSSPVIQRVYKPETRREGGALPESLPKMRAAHPRRTWLMPIHDSRATLAAVLGFVIFVDLAGCRAAVPPAALPQSSKDVTRAPVIRFGDPPAEQEESAFFPGASYDSAISSPETILGQTLGTRASHVQEILRCFERWSSESPRLEWKEIGRTHEGRMLGRAVIAHPDLLARLDQILEDRSLLFDPRGLDDARQAQILQSMPACAWLGYSIHGDELSGCDAALAVAYHLVASTDADVEDLLREVIVVIDPCQNPDGRERILAMVEQGSGYVQNLDYASMQRGRWPHGRGNHYLFDMNRDWMAGTQPETRARWSEILRFAPQLLIDAHEMGAFDTFLFYPQARPHNPFLPARASHWHTIFGADQAHAFDAQGWSYYTREWADAWAPFYTDAWAALCGAIGILYEQANTTGIALKRPSGRILTYREAVHHQVTSSMANLRTLEAHGREILEDYLADRRKCCTPESPGNQRTLVVIAGHQEDRERRFLDLLLSQGIEVEVLEEHMSASQTEGVLRKLESALDVPPGSYLIPACQPQSNLVHSFLEFDVRVDKDTLLKEREDLERKGTSRMYDDTAWSLPLAFGLQAYWCDAAGARRRKLDRVEFPAGEVAPAAQPAAVVGWVVDGRDDRSVVFARAALDLGLAVHVSDEPFSTEGRVFARGSLLVRTHENETNAAVKVQQASQTAGVTAYATSSGRSPDEGPDLGGGHFHLLERPKVALVGNAPFGADSYGHLWHWLDVELGVSATLLDVQSFPDYDLRRYNVLILPPVFGALKEVLGDSAEELRRFVEEGGTLIACASSAAALTKEPFKLSAAVLREDALADLDGFHAEADKERRARKVEIDESQVWGDSSRSDPTNEDRSSDPASPSATRPDATSKLDAKETPKQVEEARREDRWRRRFSPSGVFLRAEVDDRHWLCSGTPSEVAVFFQGDEAFYSRAPVVTPVRLVGRDRLRLSGLLWPEARERIENSAAVTLESLGRGQVILFATAPTYRNLTRLSARWFSNAVVYGPGLGASALRE